MAIPRKTALPALLTLSGIAAAFGLAACCALPLMLLTFGFGTAWLVGIGFYAGLHRPEFLAVAVVGLIGGALTLIAYRRRFNLAARSAMSAGLLIGTIMLYYGYIYACCHLAIHDHVPGLRPRRDRDDANRRLPVLLRLQRLRGGSQAQSGRLLRLLLICGRAVPAYPAGRLLPLS